MTLTLIGRVPVYDFLLSIQTQTVVNEFFSLRHTVFTLDYLYIRSLTTNGALLRLVAKVLAFLVEEFIANVVKIDTELAKSNFYTN